MIGKKLLSGALTLTTGVWLLGASFFVPVANAQTTADLQAQIAALLAQITTLQAQLNQGTTTSSSFQFTRNLTLGATGNDVKQLQVYLNSKGFVVSATGVGSVGNESTYFGLKTKAALAKFQAANGISPAVGYFGPVTRAKINGGVVVVPPGGTVPPGTSAVVISLDNPAAGTVVTNQSLADLAHFTFNGNYTITSLVFKRLGVSADTSLGNVYLFDGDTRISDSASVSSGSLITFTNGSGLFTVNGTRTISVKADLAASSGETIGVQLVSYTLSGGSPVTVNLSGNMFTVATASLASAALTSATGAGNSDPGNDILVWQGTLTIGTRDVVLKRLALRNIGSINSSDIRNFRLYVDGVQVSSQASLDSNGYVTFANVGKSITTGARTVKVLADVIAGSGRTVQMSLRGAYDITVTDTQYNVNPAVTGSFPFGPSAFTVNNGTITVLRATDSPSSNIQLNGSDVSLAKYTMTAYGESVKVETLKFAVTPGGTALATSTLRNGRVLINGVQYGSTATIGSSTPTSFTVNYTVQPGSPATVEVRADVYNNVTGAVAFVANDTLKITMKTGSANGTPSISLTPVNVPTADVDGIALTISSGALSSAKDSNYGDRNVVVPQSAYKIADFNVSNGNVEDVNVNTITLTYTTSSFALSNLTDLYVKWGASQTSVKATPSASGDSFSVNFTVPKNATIPVEVYGSISSGATNNSTLVVNMALTATTASSGQSANTSATGGQTLTMKTGGSISAVTDGSTVSQILPANTNDVVVAAVKFSAVDDGFTITDVIASTTNASAVTALRLFDGATEVQSKSGNTTTSFTGLNISVPANGSKTLYIKANLGNVGTGYGSTGSAITSAITDVIAKSASNGVIVAETGLPVAGSAMYVYKSIPVVTRIALSDTLLSAGTKTVAKFSIGSSNSESVAWRKLVFAVTTSSATTTFTSPTFWGPDGVQIAGTATTTGGVIAFTADADQVVTAAKEYTMKATLGGAIATGDSISFAFNRPSSHINSTTLSTAQNGSTATLVWSDMSGAPHSDSSSDWSNDNLVKNLPADTWTLSK